MKKVLLLLPAILGPALLLTGAWPGPAPPAAIPAPSLFVAQSVAVNHDLIGAEATGAQILDKALAQFAPGRLLWLRTQVWQKMSEAPIAFEAEGTLDLAPGACVRLDLGVITAMAKGRLLTVSDGHVLAQVLHFGGASPQTTTHLLPKADGQGDHGLEALRFLEEKGCGGPGLLLVSLRRHLRQMRLCTGTLAGRAVIQLKGELDEQAAAPLPASTPARYACLYLDAQTLWPHRLEWWAFDAKRGARAVVEMEFRAAVLNRELPHEECARLFSYRPEE